ncbi:MAG: alkaline phosphatase family protein [Desulfomonile sp.]|nr:alkaline phosphatase family protein [Desulfomonile sp.]
MNLTRRTAVLGLDGVPYSLLQRLFQQGIMPCLAREAAQGAFLRMRTTLPPVSPVAWTSFLTGEGPGAHGIFGFTDLKPGMISTRLPSFDDVRSPVIWQQRPDLRAIVINVPFTYPARPLNGILIAGFTAPLLDRAVYPPELLPWLNAKDYQVDADIERGRYNKHVLLEELFRLLSLHGDVMASLLATRPWDLFIGVITGTDRLNHFFFDAAYDPSHPFHKDFIDYYRAVDTFVGRFREKIGSDTRLVILSDHGFTSLKTQVYVNHILRSKGWLRFKGESPALIDDVHPDSVAFAMDANRVYLNTRDRFRGGAVSRTEKIEVLRRLQQELRDLTLGDAGITDPDGVDGPGDLLFDHVLSREEIYEGDCLHLAPDLILLPRRGYDLKGQVNVTAPSAGDVFTGMHTPDDAFLIVDDPALVDRLPSPKITDVAGLVLKFLSQAC